MLDKVQDGRTDLAFNYLSGGNAPDSMEGNGISIPKHCESFVRRFVKLLKLSVRI